MEWTVSIGRTNKMGLKAGSSSRIKNKEEEIRQRPISGGHIVTLVPGEGEPEVDAEPQGSWCWGRLTGQTTVLVKQRIYRDMKVR